MKVVYNDCFGAFSLSHEGIMRYAEITGMTLYPDERTYATFYWTCADTDVRVTTDLFFDRDIKRSDPALVRTVEELGKKADGHFAELKIRDVPKGERYRIDEDNGSECVMLCLEYNWEIAT